MQNQSYNLSCDQRSSRQLSLSQSMTFEVTGISKLLTNLVLISRGQMPSLLSDLPQSLFQQIITFKGSLWVLTFRQQGGVLQHIKKVSITTL